MIIILADLTINPEKEQAFREAVKPLVAASQKEEGNISYSLKQDVENPAHFTMVEMWESAEAIQKHNEAEHFKAFSAQAAGFLAGPVTVRSFDANELK
ncbi:putative quinol monooxygenase [Jeotgalibacillus aurantiacus]|uniref:putative quinol monooxygenase n=1 Tax=Jeotgalibacillus aurantiacus TaxID=2763266 RepID=UPI001D0AAD33|nr:putative quinol monooxygenase [Jeotgalibacillus aurantiacus]